MASLNDEKNLSQQLAQRLKKSYAVIDALEAKLCIAQQLEPIAIVGMGCRFPGGVDSPDKFWQLLMDERGAITDVPPERWDVSRYFGEKACSTVKMTSCRGGFVDDVDRFDAGFFNLSSKEAIAVDPQHRLLLEVVWHALEQGNQRPETLQGSDTGVFVAMSCSDYMLAQAKYQGEDKINAYFGIGNAHAAACGRIAYFLGLQGPCFSVDTACSASLVALHNAVISLQRHESSAAIVAAANLHLTPDISLSFSAANMLAPDGRCKTFDQSADGYVRGEGVAVFILKRLSDARKAGDRVLAVIRGSALNQDGASGGLTVPNGVAQQAVIRKALQHAGLEASAVSYVEAHGTGTALGDPIEIAALGAAYCQQRNDDNPLYVGAVKTNIGHTEACAGLAGLLKVVLSLQHQTLPRHLNFTHPSSLIAWDEYPIKVVERALPWQAPGERIAGLSAFGFGGSNGHILISEGDRPGDADDSGMMEYSPARYCVKVSAKSASAFKELALRYGQHLQRLPQTQLADFCFTANNARSDHPWRRLFVADSKSALETMLLSPPVVKDVAPEDVQVAFLFSGQGSQYWGMAEGLYKTNATFKAALDECERLLAAQMDKPLRTLLWGADRTAIDSTRYTQPALFAVEYALACLWQHWGVKPTILLGHSVGEYVAACLAGVFSLESALTLVAARGRLMEEYCAAGAMAVVFASRDEVMPFLLDVPQQLAIAACNGPENTVISGDAKVLATQLNLLQQAGYRNHPLTVSHGFHSPLMAPMLDAFRQVAEKVAFFSPKQAIVSNVSGKLAGNEMSCAAYWVEHISAPVMFMPSVETLLVEGVDILLELGPAAVLTSMARQIASHWLDQQGTASKVNHPLYCLHSLSAGEQELDVLHATLANLYAAGVVLDWPHLVEEQGNLIDLPTYPFARTRYWYDYQRENTTPSPVSALSHGSLAQDGYELCWQPVNLPEGDQQVGATITLIITDDADEIETLQQLLVEQGSVVTVRLTDVAALLKDDRADWADGLQAQRVERCFIYLSRDSEDATRYSYAVTRCLSTLQTLVQQCHCSLITRGASLAPSAGASYSATCGQICALGASRALVAEVPELFRGVIDLPVAHNSAIGRAEAKIILALAGSAEQEELTALRGDTLLVPRLEKCQLNSVSRTVLPDANGAYLITGAFGALGQSVIQWLVGLGVRQLALVGRRQKDAPEVINNMAQLQAQGVDCWYLQADVADYAELTAAIASQQLPALAGIFHIAGVAGDIVANAQLNLTQYRQVLQPKVQGLMNLHRLIQEYEFAAGIQLLVNFSSISAIWGSSGQVGYCAANYFLDYYSQQLRQQGINTLSVNWGPWSEAGIGAQIDHAAILAKLGIGSFSHAEALDLLASALSLNLPQIVIARVNWPQFVPLVFARRVSRLCTPLLPEITESATVISTTRLSHYQQLPPAQQPTFLLHCVVETVRIVCERRDDEEELDPRLGFTAMGIDSLLSVEVKQRLQNDFGLKLPATLLFDYPTPRALATYLHTLLSPAEGALNPALTLQNTTTSSVDFSQMSDGDVEAMLLEKLSTL